MKCHATKSSTTFALKKNKNKEEKTPPPYYDFEDMGNFNFE
jgi:hypothetical protein